jgi:type I restriction enzyme, S subunit
MANWKKYKLEDLAVDIAMGPFGSNIKTDNFQPFGVPVIRGQNLVEGGFEYSNFVFISEEKAQSLKRSIAYPDELVFTHRGTLGQVGVIPKNKYPYYLVSQSQMRLAVKKDLLSPKYLFYFFKTPIGQRELLKNVSQVGVPAIASPTKSLKDVDITIPDLSTQTCIASILTSLDDKIELNRRMNQTLEQMGQVLFNHYFVDNIDIDNLPEGWRIGKLGKILELKYGKALKENQRNKGNYAVVGSGGIIGYHDEFICKGKGIVVGRKGNSGAVSWLHEDFYPIDTTFYVSDSLGVKDLYYHYFLLKSLNLKNLNSDSAVPGLNRNEARNQEIVIPENKNIKAFNNSVSSFFNRININLNEIKRLTTIRDTLLPKLMSGEIDVDVLMKEETVFKQQAIENLETA